jgi:hypothetical protein
MFHTTDERHKWNIENKYEDKKSVENKFNK